MNEVYEINETIKVITNADKTKKIIYDIAIELKDETHEEGKKKI